MATISKDAWWKYIFALRKIDEEASFEARRYMSIHDFDFDSQEEVSNFIDYCYGLATKYGEASSALACEMYEAIAEMSGKTIPPAVPAQTASYGDVATATYGTLGQNPSVTAGAIGRLVKLAGVDTMQQNALRDGAEWAWIPVGDTCAFCLTLASRGWQKASKKAIKNGHAEHVHANCDCTYAIRFDDSVDIEGYNPDEYYLMYKNADGNTPQQKINAMRRDFYAKNKKRVNEQNVSARAKSLELNGSAAEEINVSNNDISQFERQHYQDSSESGLLLTESGKQLKLGGDAHHVISDKDVLEQMNNGTFTHNHPTDVTFSENDISSGLIKGNLKEMRAATSGGKVHILINNGADLDDKRKFLTQFGAARRRAENTAADRIRRRQMNYGEKQQYVNSRLEAWLTENAPKYNLEYKIIKVK